MTGDRQTMNKEAPGLRWWPLGIVAVLVGLALLVIWGFLPDLSGQARVLNTYYCVGVGLLLFWAWLLLLSRLRWKTSLWIVCGVLGAALVAWTLVRWDVTGDLVPILTWRWSPSGLTDLKEEDLAPAARAVDLTRTSARDYPQFLGPRRDAVVADVRLARRWQAEPPRLLWRRAIGAGWSSFAVVGNYAVTQEQRGEFELVVCYSLATGEDVWMHADRTRFEESIAGVGPRATPTVSRGKVYTLGATGILNCLDGATGKRLWQRNILTDNGAENNDWGKSCSPLVFGTLVVVSAGGEDGQSLVAYDRESGEPVWGGGNDESGYSSPFLAKLGGRDQIVIFNKRSVVAHDPTGGDVLWEYRWSNASQNVSQPLPVGDDRLLVSSGYGVGCALLQVADTGGSLTVKELWKSRNLKAKFTNVVRSGGFAYGLDDAILVCLDLQNGKRRWKGGRYGHGQVMLVDDLLLLQAESGEVVLVEAVPEAHRELTRFQAIDGKTWNHPALAGNRLLVRNHREAACYELPLAAE